jgi:hypothetical protein
MKLVTFLVLFAACTSGNVCQDDHCVCAADEPCEHTCSSGGLDCAIQCTPNETCDVVCAPGETCHVEASSASHSTVDCNGSTDCHVTCPLGGCTVNHCEGFGCVVACATGGEGTANGTTVSCP